MKTLVNKNNPAIRIIAPEEAVKERPSCWAIWPEGYKGCRSLLLDKDEWTLVEEESKHTEVWVEGRTIFEQEEEPVGLEKEIEKAQEPVDLEKEIEKAQEHYFALKEQGFSLDSMDVSVLARHFYELGMKEQTKK